MDFFNRLFDVFRVVNDSARINMIETPFFEGEGFSVSQFDVRFKSIDVEPRAGDIY